jgi:hypothetical protein
MFIVVNATGQAHNFSDSRDPETIAAAHGLTLDDVTIYTNDEYRALAEVQDEILSVARQAAIQRIEAHAALLMSVHVEAFASFAIIDFMVSIWPMLDKTNTPAEITAAQAIYSYAKTKISQSKNATQAQLEAYDPTTDANWPE